MASTMPPVPRRWERPFHAPASNKDFIAENAFAAMTAAPRFKTKTQTDWLKTDTYGRVPAYLDRVKREIESEREYILSLLDQQAMEAEAESGAQTRELSSDERNELIDALKAKWDVVNAKYQQISHRKISTSNSSMGEIRWKETCEQQMAQLEKDIDRLSHHGPVYVVE